MYFHLFLLFCGYLFLGLQICLGQSSSEILIEKTIWLNKEKSFSDKKWYNEAFKIDLADFKELSDITTIHSISYWVGLGDKQLKKVKAKSKSQKIKNILHSSLDKSQTTDNQEDMFEVNILRDYVDTTQYNCTEKFLNGGFIIYRIDSDCYWHHQTFAKGGFARAKLTDKSPKMTRRRVAFVLRSKHKLDQAIFVKVVVMTNSKTN